MHEDKTLLCPSCLDFLNWMVIWLAVEWEEGNLLTNSLKALKQGMEKKPTGGRSGGYRTTVPGRTMKGQNHKLGVHFSWQVYRQAVPLMVVSI